MSIPYTGPSHFAKIISQLEQGNFIHHDGSVSPIIHALGMPEQEPKGFRRIPFSDYKDLYVSIVDANFCCRVLNTFVTIPWHKSSHGDFHPALAKAVVARLQSEWSRSKVGMLRRDSKYVFRTAVWVCEPGKTGVHYIQLLVHVPYGFQDKFSLCLANALDHVVRRRGSARRKTYSPYLAFVSPNFDRDTASQWKLFRYMTNGLDAGEALQLLHDDHSSLLFEEFGDGFVRTTRIEKWAEAKGQVGTQTFKLFKHILWGSTTGPEVTSIDEALTHDDRFLLAGEKKAQARANKWA